MPYLTYVGPDLYRGGLASRGYWVFRRGNAVVVRFGAIRFDRHRGYKVRWTHGFNERVIRCRTKVNAIEKLRRLINEKTHQKHGYRILSKGKRIEGS